jgi:hypothetical protein
VLCLMEIQPLFPTLICNCSSRQILLEIQPLSSGNSTTNSTYNCHHEVPQVIASCLSSLLENSTRSRHSTVPRCSHRPCLLGRKSVPEYVGGGYGVDLLEVAFDPAGQSQTGTIM